MPTSADQRVVGPAGALLAVTGLALAGVDRLALRRRSAAGRQTGAVGPDADVPGREIGGRDRLAEAGAFGADGGRASP